MLTWLRQRRSAERISRALYGSSVSAARAQTLYADLGVPDTLAGRFEMVVLHTFIIMHRLAKEGDRGRALAQSVVEAMIEQIDDDYRQLGVSDVTVPKRVRQAASAAYGRFEAYRAAVDAGDRAALAAAIVKNVFDGDATRLSAAESLATHALASVMALADQPAERLFSGVVTLPHHGAPPR